MRFEVVDRCGRCHGNGAEPGTPIKTCTRCGGNGVLQAVSRTPFGQIARTVSCDVCGGDGKVAEKRCTRCDGRGREVLTHAVSVDIPAGIAEGQRIRVTGRGHAGDAGGPQGDLYVHVTIAPHERFIRDGNDLVTVARRAGADGGAGHEARGADARRASRTSTSGPARSPARPTSCAGAACRTCAGPGRRGDLRVITNVIIPRQLTDEQKRLMERLAETMTDSNTKSEESMFSKLKRVLQG